MIGVVLIDIFLRPVWHAVQRLGIVSSDTNATTFIQTLCIGGGNYVTPVRSLHTVWNLVKNLGILSAGSLSLVRTLDRCFGNFDAVPLVASLCSSRLGIVVGFLLEYSLW